MLEEEAAKAAAANRAGSNGPNTEMSKQCNHARLVSLAESTQMKTQRVLVDREAKIQLSVKDHHFRLELHMDPGHAVKREGK